MPGGIGFGASLAAPYAELGYDLIGGAQRHGGRLRRHAGRRRRGSQRPPTAIVVSEESGRLLGRDGLAAPAALRERGHPVYAVRPQDVHFTEEALLVPEGGSPGPRDAAPSRSGAPASSRSRCSTASSSSTTSRTSPSGS